MQQTGVGVADGVERAGAGQGGSALKVSVYTSAYRGGASWFVLELAASLAGAGCDVLLIAPQADPDEREQLVASTRRLKLQRGAYGEGGKLTRIRRTVGRILSTFRAFATARRHGRTYVISFYDWLSVLVAQMLWIRLLGGRIVYVVHDASPHAWSSSGLMRRVERALLRATYTIPQQIVALTGVARDQLRAEYGCKRPITVIPHGAYAAQVTSPLPGNRVLLVFGMLRRNKRIKETIEGVKAAVAAGQQVRLVIAGAPHKEDLGYWDECAALLEGTGDYIHCEIGFVPEARLDQLIAECDAVMLPYEEFNSQSGVAVLAACSERLLLCTDAGGLAELIGQGMEAVVVARPVTAATIADAIARFCALPVEEARARSARSKASLDAYLDWGRIGHAYAAVCRGDASSGA